jgi:hypothetical protein
MHTKRRHRRKLLFEAWPLEAAARRLTAPRSCSVPKKRCSCRSPRAAGRCAQKGAVAVGCLAACPHEAAMARRLKAPRSCSPPKSRCSCRSPRAAGRCAQRGRNRRGLHCCRATEWWRRRGRTAFVQTSQDQLQVPLTASGGAMRTKRGHRQGFAVGPPRVAAWRLEAPRLCSAPKSRCSCRSPSAAGRCAQKGHRLRLLCSLGARGGGAKIDGSTLIPCDVRVRSRRDHVLCLLPCLQKLCC